jgi:hypothetical protein
MLCHTLEAAVDFIAPAICGLSAPGNDMVLEDPLMKLVMYIRGEALEDVGVW